MQPWQKTTPLIGLLVMLFFATCSKDDEPQYNNTTTNTSTTSPTVIMPDSTATETGIIIDPLLLRPKLPPTPFNYADVSLLPNHFNSVYLNFLDNSPNNNPINDAGATLGRVLFYDTKLSINNTIACASCHKQANAFSDPNQFSTGHNGEQTNRNAMSLVNLRYGFRFFWDLSATSLEEQVLMPIENTIEMGMPLNELVPKLQSIDYYPPLFEAAFGSPTVSTDGIAKALAQFLRSIMSYNAKYDEGITNDFTNFTAQENLGRALFFNGQTGCNFCHTSEAFFSSQALNTGLESNYSDLGAGNGRFKAVTLRNIGLTAPYMHDGRFTTLEEVITQYNENIQAHPFLDDRLTTNGQIGGPPKQLNLSAAEQAALVAFLHTLTDYNLLETIKFSNPFVH